MNSTIKAGAQIKVRADVSSVWDALTDPEKIKKYMFGTNVKADWRVGGKITWEGKWEGKKYLDEGEILEYDPEKLMKYSHQSIEPKTVNSQHIHIVTVTLNQDNDEVLIELIQENVINDEAKEAFEANWNMMLENLKDLLEK